MRLRKKELGIGVFANDKHEIAVALPTADVGIFYDFARARTRGLDEHTLFFPEPPFTLADAGVKDHIRAGVSATDVGHDARGAEVGCPALGIRFAVQQVAHRFYCSLPVIPGVIVGAFPAVRSTHNSL